MKDYSYRGKEGVMKIAIAARVSTTSGSKVDEYFETDL